ncbi:MAG: GNAT family N-acetyltransferase [Treponema sp.]|jgi:GNAT superfamily N-acetyltransferase|nr:GNAT family N-acetyltransferase [Treponema sp.]
MTGNYFKWKNLKNKDIPYVENLLRDMEDTCVGACSRFLFRVPTRDHVWVLRGKNGELPAVIINSRNTLMPVFGGLKEIPSLRFLKGFFRLKNIHSTQGLTEEVLIMESELEKLGKVIVDIFDYDLMRLDVLPWDNKKYPTLENLTLRKASLIDLDNLAPLQAGYEKEEVLPKGSVFSPAASRINLSNLIAKSHVMLAEYNGRVVGKINISGVSFTRYQVGGVYVHPDFRGKGIARRMAKEFITSLINEGRGVSLFVKKNNMPARRLYTGLGLRIIGNYRITYY